MNLDLTQPCAQATFGGLVGVAQPVIAALLARGVLREGAPAGVWILAYAKHLRDLAHGRGGAVSEARERLLRAQSERFELENKIRAGSLCEARDVETGAARAGAIWAQAMDSFPASVAADLVNLPDARTARRVVAAALREARQRAAAQISAQQSPAAKAQVPVPDAAELELTP
jgi:hypothetical protein